MSTPETQPAQLEAAFHAHERMLWGLSYRLTGCAADADDIVQETFVRAMERAPHTPDAGEAPARPWLVRVALNVGLDMLRRRRRRAYVGPWLPSPIETPDEAATDVRASPEGHYEMLESVSFAFLLALEALSPRQRAVLLLRDVFDYSAREAAQALDLSEANVRIIHHRARRAMDGYDRERCVPTQALQEQTRRALEEFVRCLMNQDVAGIEALLAESARTVTDGGGEYNAVRVPIIGRAKVAVFHLRVAQRRGPGARVRLCMMNGLPAVAIDFAEHHRNAAPRILLRCDVNPDGRIKEVHSILTSRKLSAVSFGEPV